MIVQIRITSTLVSLAPPIVFHSLSVFTNLILPHLTLYKYTPKALNLLTLLHPIIFLYATYSLILRHSALRN
jgi:hypothetical protein